MVLRVYVISGTTKDGLKSFMLYLTGVALRPPSCFTTTIPIMAHNAGDNRTLSVTSLNSDKGGAALQSHCRVSTGKRSQGQRRREIAGSAQTRDRRINASENSQDPQEHHMEESRFSQWLHLLGLLALSYLVLKQVWTLLSGVRNHLLSRWWRTNLKQYGGWADYIEYILLTSPTVVTGATDGIGKAYAMELARRGFDVVLISRKEEKLEKVAKEIEKQTQQKTKIIQVDFTGGSDIYPKVEKALKDLDIGLLVNNVGMSLGIPGRFLDTPDLNQRIEDIMNCNVFSMVHMTRIVLPGMVRRKRGVIINVSSATGARPFPMVAMYGSTKVFMDFFSRSLNFEYRRDGIIVQSVLAHLVSTNMAHNPEPTILVKSSEEFAWEALNTVGYTHRTHGCISHAIQGYIMDLLLTDAFMNSQICRSIAGWVWRRIL
ncbi:very-long-chain 3-oxoacyl-CoA reductase-B-like [Dendropsophus ebraccatus]|uniref:very-long-chain 3-oxoacyl-CoA reductase-B-like n=1 Tax=Dendropsophus ebraccatus TaxID=150705 RepID=UPI0038317AAC